eukprot:CAMPEP_0181413748 /NCGR_PEP_ID=MMETSP1110-20121109/9137_1 /TAXON_ID=174948 /ORGANISM="Symbiodinium sp., Strain CCMP421" /LENGTH=39 /DNA_ID= /DNA_START= /DNA_END= /DNA_ORIENTATION=
MAAASAISPAFGGPSSGPQSLTALGAGPQLPTSDLPGPG